MGAPKKYTPKQLDTAVNKYFKSISRTITVTEAKPTGQRDEKGHMIYEQVEVKNDMGKPVEQTEFIIPPTVSGLCLALKIHRSTWDNYCEDPEYFDTTTHARGLMRAWNEMQLLTRPGKEVKGIIFNLQNNYGYAEHQQVAVTGGSVEEFLKSLQENGEAQEF